MALSAAWAYHLSMLAMLWPQLVDACVAEACTGAMVWAGVAATWAGVAAAWAGVGVVGVLQSGRSRHSALSALFCSADYTAVTVQTWLSDCDSACLSIALVTGQLLLRLCVCFLSSSSLEGLLFACSLV
jgi:hypothetical protein